MENKPHPHKVLLSAEMLEEGIIDLNIQLQGCDDFLEISLLNIFLTIYENDLDLFMRVMDKFMERTLKK